MPPVDPNQGPNLRTHTQEQLEILEASTLLGFHFSQPLKWLL